MKITTHDNFRVVVTPKRLGDFGWMSLPDDRASRNPEADMRERCQEIAEQVKRHVDNVAAVSVASDVTHTCSFCHYEWEELTAEQATDPGNLVDGHSVAGEPVCCQWAIDEFRTERGIPRTDAGVVAYRNPSRPGVLLCREHGYAVAGLVPLGSEDLPDGGICTHDDCGRDVLIVEAGEPA